MPLSLAAAHRKDLSTRASVMTHQHFRTIAAIIRAMPTHAPTLRAQRESCASAFADALSLTNPRFNRARFLSACLNTEEM